MEGREEGFVKAGCACRAGLEPGELPAAAVLPVYRAAACLQWGWCSPQTSTLCRLPHRWFPVLRVHWKRLSLPSWTAGEGCTGWGQRADNTGYSKAVLISKLSLFLLNGPVCKWLSQGHFIGDWGRVSGPRLPPLPAGCAGGNGES